MTYELTIFVIMTIIFIGGGLLNIFHYKPKEISERKKTAHGLISLTIGAWATVTLLIMGGFI